MKSFLVTLFYRSEIIVRTAVTELGNLSIMEIIGFQGGRGQVVVLVTKGKVAVVAIWTAESKQLSQ